MSFFLTFLSLATLRPPQLPDRRRETSPGWWARRLTDRRTCPGLTSIAYRYGLVNPELLGFDFQGFPRVSHGFRGLESSISRPAA
jgi:hypothetical protein